MDINIIGSIFSIGGALFAFYQAYLSRESANEAKKYLKKYSDNENIEKLSSVLTDLKNIQNEIRNLKSSFNQRGANLTKKSNGIQEKLDEIFIIAPFIYKNLNNEIKRAQAILQKGFTESGEIIELEKNIYEIISIVKEERDKIKTNIN